MTGLKTHKPWLRWSVSLETAKGLCRGRRIAYVVFLLVAAAMLCLGAPPGVLRTTVTLRWDQYPTNQITPDLVLKIYSSTNATAPLSTWPLIATVNPTNTTATLPIDGHQRYYVMTSSNWYGEGDFSVVAATVAPPRSDLNLRIGP